MIFSPSFQNKRRRLCYDTSAAGESGGKGDAEMEAYTIEEVELLRKKSGMTMKTSPTANANSW